MTAPVEHPAWCARTLCLVTRTAAGVQVHVSRAVTIGSEDDPIWMELTIQQIKGQPPHVVIDAYRNQRHAITVGLSIAEAILAGRTLLDLAQTAGNGA